MDNGQVKINTFMNEFVGFEIVNGKRIFYVFSEPSGPKEKKIVIMSHGFRGSSIGPARTFVDFARILLKEGYSVLRFDQPNSGNSEGDYLESSFIEWVNTIVHFADKFISQGYKTVLLGQSMGATATTIASNQDQIRGKIPAMILWVPGPSTDFNEDPSQIGEENGQRYKNTYWYEACQMDFFNCLNLFQGSIHLVYGEHDKFVSSKLRKKTAEIVRSKNQKALILPGEPHSPWSFDAVQKVYGEEVSFLCGYV